MPAFTAVPSRSGGAAGPLPTAAQARARRGTQGPTLWTGGSEEQSGHAQEVVAESRAEQERCGRGMKRLSRRGGAQGPGGSSWGRQLASCSEVLRVCGVPGWLQQLLPGQILGWLLSLGDGRKSRLRLGPTALGLAHGRSMHDRFIHFIPSRCTLRVRLNQFVMVALGSFVSR